MRGTPAEVRNTVFRDGPYRHSLERCLSSSNKAQAFQDQRPRYGIEIHPGRCFQILEMCGRPQTNWDDCQHMDRYVIQIPPAPPDCLKTEVLDDGVSDDWFAEPTTKPRDFVRTSVNTESGAERGEKKSHRLLPRSVGASHHHSESERPPDLRDALAKSSKSDLNASSDRQLPSDLLTSASLNAPHSTTAIIKQRAAPPQSAEPLATEDHEPRKLSIRDQRRRRRAENHHNEKKTNGQSSRTASTDTAVSVPSPKASTTLTTLSNPTNDAHVPEEPIAPVKQKASNDTPPLPPPSLHQISVTPPPQIQPTGPLHMKAGFRSANVSYLQIALSVSILFIICCYSSGHIQTARISYRPECSR